MTDRTPAQGRSSFHCPSCGVYAQQRWSDVYYSTGGGGIGAIDGFTHALCASCGEASLWRMDAMIYPLERLGSPPHDDMPEKVLSVYEEARSVAPISKKSAAGLLRLALQMLVDDLEVGGGSIDQKIGKLVQRGLDPQVQRAMDVLRVMGNESVHPGTIDLDADPELLDALFGLANLIVEQVITRPKHVSDLFSKLPAEKLEAIERRDGTA